MVANAEHIDALLKGVNLAATLIRRQVLGLLWGPGTALTRKEIEKGLDAQADRVTIYRTLKVLSGHGLVHKIIMDDQQVKYKLAARKHGDDHPHFFCTVCQQMSCLSVQLINTGQLPEGYQVNSAQVVLEGICGKCNSK